MDRASLPAGRPPPRSVVVGVGDELLLGRTVDRNGAWLGRALADLGIPMRRHLSVGDAPDEIADAVRWGLGAADVVVVTGGLGPTRDDRTRDAVARALGRPLRRDPAVAAGLLERVRARGADEPPAGYLRQADVPDGARVLLNARGSAPGLLLEADGRVLVLLPGVPAEMEWIFREQAAPHLVARFGEVLRPVRVRMLHTTGVPESELAGRVAPALPPEDGPVEVAFLPRIAGVDLRLTVPGTLEPEEAEARLEEVERALVPLIEPHLYRAPSGDVAEAVARELENAGKTVSVAESCTGGLLGKRLTDRAGASSFFSGGIIAYADGVKLRELEVDGELLQREGAVSQKVAEAMAQGVAKRFGTDFGMAITGVAGPGGGSREKPVGTVCWAVAHRGEVTARRARFSGDRAAIRERSAEAALALLLRILKDIRDPNASE